MVELTPKLADLATAEEKEALLLKYYPTIYVACLSSSGRKEKLASLYDGGEVNSENVPWYIHVQLLPMFAKMRKENKLLPN